MTKNGQNTGRLLPLAGLLLALTGCHGPQHVMPATGPHPHEGAKASLDEYVANPPDELVIMMEAAPSPNQVLKPGDVVNLKVKGTLEEHPLDGPFQVRADSSVDLGTYGPVTIGGLTVDKAKEAIKQHLLKDLADAEVTTLALVSVLPISGNYLIRPDGYINLGFYGNVQVAGMSLSQIEAAIKKHLAEHHGLVNAKVSVDVGTYNSMVYYIITDGAGSGDRVITLPVTGRETVLDAMGEMGGLPAVASRKNIWIARPLPGEPDMAEILPVDWMAITKHGATGTNYQIQPGDRIYVKADKLIAADSFMGKVIAPIERVMGAITLFDITIESLQFSRQNQGGSGF